MIGTVIFAMMQLTIVIFKILFTVIVAFRRTRSAIAIMGTAVLSQVVRTRESLVAVVANVWPLLRVGADMSRQSVSSCFFLSLAKGLAQTSSDALIF
jgi:hypothetical protein